MLVHRSIHLINRPFSRPLVLVSPQATVLLKTSLLFTTFSITLSGWCLVSVTLHAALWQATIKNHQNMKDYGNSCKEPPFDKLPVPAEPETIGIRVTLRVLDRLDGKIVFFRELVKIDSIGEAKSSAVIQEWSDSLRGKSVRTYAFTHGFGGSLEYDDEDKLHKGWIPKAIDMLVDREKRTENYGASEMVNFLSFDWSDGAAGKQALAEACSGTAITYKLFGYDQAASNTRPVGVTIAKFLHTFSDLLPPANIHLIGFSLGAHVMGFAGKQYQFLENHKVARITGLDPAGPLFNLMSSVGRLDETDAAFVDAIHTNAGIFGIKRRVAHADFWVGRSPEDTWLYHNEHKWGSAQPACFDCLHKATANVAFKVVKTLDLRSQGTAADKKEGDMSDKLGMSHYRAHIYFRHTIADPTLFQGEADIENNNAHKTAAMGFDCPTTTRGSFNVELNEKTPQFSHYFSQIN